jgi:hypothetical protein
MSFDTISWMKVLAVKGIEKYSNLWEVRYTRQHGKTVQDAVFLCDTPEEAKQKYKELLDILIHHDGVHIGSKEKRKVKTINTRPAYGGCRSTCVQPIRRTVVRALAYVVPLPVFFKGKEVI